MRQHLCPASTRVGWSRPSSVRLLPITGSSHSPGANVLITIAVILLILWALGLTVFNVGGLIHILLVIAIVVVLLRIIQGRRPV